MNGFLALALMILIVLLVLGLSVFVLRRSRRKVNFEFDERQLQAQGQAFTLAGLVTISYLGLLIAFLPEQIDGAVLRPLLFLGIDLYMLVFGTYAILSDAYVGRSDKVDNKYLAALVFGISYLVMFVVRTVLRGGVIPLENESAWRSLIFGMTFGYLGILLLIKDKRSRKEDADGEE